ncbi:MAG: transposase [Thermoprotei archaeon]
MATDGTRLKTGSAREYLTFRYGKPGKQKKRVVLVITVDVRRRKLLAVDAYIEGRSHSEVKTAAKMITEVKEKGKKVRKFYGDGAYDAMACYAKARARKGKA